jgi:hypothetical protein
MRTHRYGVPPSVVKRILERLNLLHLSCVQVRCLHWYMYFVKTWNIDNPNRFDMDEP